MGAQPLPDMPDAGLGARPSAPPADAKVTIHDLGVVFPGQGGSPSTEALAAVSLAVGDHEFVAVLGPSGCGKTTLLNVVAGFLTPTRGEVRLDGRLLRGPGPDRGVVFQQGALFPWLTVRGNVEYGLKVARVPASERAKRAGHWIEVVGLSDAADKWPYQLSGGMQQRVGIARALAIEPEVLLMDEPFGALDAQTRTVMQAQLIDIWQRDRRTVIFVTHDIMESLLLADRVVVMGERGRIQAELRPEGSRPRSRTDSLLLKQYEQISRLLGLDV